MMRVALALLGVAGRTAAVQPFSHGWDTPKDMMAMHGKYKTLPLDKDIHFVAEHYGGMITTGTGCPSEPTGDTIEESVLEVARRIKEINPRAVVGMYWRTDFALEVAQCSGYAAEWAAHPEYRLKDDNGTVCGKPNHYYYDWLNPAASDFFAKILLNVTLAKMPSGMPVLDYIYCDGAGAWNPASPKPFQPNVGLDRSHKLLNAKHAMFGRVQRQMDARGLGQALILNGMDLESTAEQFVATGVAGAMFDHWSILQFLDRQTGEFNATMVAEGFELVTSPLVSNFTTQIKGWVGPVVQQRGHYPPNYAQITTPAAQITEALERYNSELALFLLVATEHDFWIYSWFWGWYDYVGGNESSSIPPDFFPQAKCPLGEPAGPMQRVAGTWTFKRQFAHASVFVDLTNRTASKVDFIGCQYPTPPLPPGPQHGPPPPPPPPPPLHHGACAAQDGHGCAACVAAVDGRCPSIWCNQPCVHLSKVDTKGHDCQPASWWNAHGRASGATCEGNATGCKPVCG